MKVKKIYKLIALTAIILAAALAFTACSLPSWWPSWMGGTSPAVTIPGDGNDIDPDLFKSHLYIELTEITGLNITLYITKTGEGELTIDWGDYTAFKTVITNGVSINYHIYEDYGTYDITVWRSSGACTYAFGNNAATGSLFGLETSAKSILVNCVIGNDVIVILSSSFTDCIKLKSFIISDSVTSIGSYAFYECVQLESISIPAGVINIAITAFFRCFSLESIIIYGAPEIAYGAFAQCSALREVILHSTVPPVVAIDVFIATNTVFNFYVPDGYIEVYRTDSFFSNYYFRIFPISARPVG